MCMVDLLINGIVENRNSINNLARNVKTNVKLTNLSLFLLTISFYAMSKKIKEQNDIIKKLEKDFATISSKGE